MKKILTVGFLALISTSLFAINIFKYVPFEGNVKSYSQTDFSISSKFGNFLRTPKLKVVHVFDQKGNEVESTEYTPRDVLINKIVSTYDKNNNLIEQKCINDESEIVWKNVISYKNGKKVDISEYDNNNNLKTRTIFTYKSDSVCDESLYDSDGALISKVIFKKEPNKETISTYFSNGSLDTEEIITYSENGSIESVVRFSSLFDGLETDIFRYTDGKLTEITTYDENKEVIYRLVIKYDSTGNVSRVSNYEVLKKFGTTVTDLIDQTDYVFEY